MAVRDLARLCPAVLRQTALVLVGVGFYGLFAVYRAHLFTMGTPRILDWPYPDWIIEAWSGYPRSKTGIVPMWHMDYIPTFKALIYATCGAFTLAALCAWSLTREWLHRWAHPFGFCPHCRYDLRGTIWADRDQCPECGHRIDSVTRVRMQGERGNEQ